MPIKSEVAALGKDYTPIQEEIASQTAMKVNFLAFGVVRECLDSEHAGRIKVACAAFPRGEEVCDYVSPIAGGDYGMFAVPGIGSTVLVGQTSFHDPPTQYFWMGCLYTPGNESCDTIKTQPYIKEESGVQMARTVVKDNGEEVTHDLKVSYGTPDENSLYGTNHLPDSFVLKHPCGHTFVMTDKKSSQTIEKLIKIKTAENKRLIMSDGPPSAGGDNILLADENGNQLRITSNAKATEAEDTGVTDNSIVLQSKGLQTLQSLNGGVMVSVGKLSSDDIEIANAGNGDINIAAFGNDGSKVRIQAPKQKGRIELSCGDSSIIISNEGIRINAPDISINGGGGDVNVNNISLTNHTHQERGKGNMTSTPK